MRSFIFLFAVQLLVRDNGFAAPIIDGFEYLPKTWCRGGTGVILSGIEDDSAKCAALCLSVVNSEKPCYGYNWRSVDGLCATFSVGCVESPSAAWSFYRVSGMSFQTTEEQPLTLRTLPTTMRRTQFTSTTTAVATVPTTTTSRPTIITTTTEFIPIQQSTAQTSTHVAGDYLSQFQRYTDTACFGGDNVGPGQSTFSKGRNYCAQQCAVDANCAGFIISDRHSGDCEIVPIAKGCRRVLESDAMYEFVIGMDWYEKLSGASPPRTATTTRPTPVVETLPSVDPNSYQREKGKRCVSGASSTVTIESVVSECVAACDSDPSCIGFNYQPEHNVCQVRTIGCDEEDHVDGFVFYRKLSAIVTTPLAVKSTTTREDFPHSANYVLAANAVCEGMEIWSGYINPDGCAAICNKNSNCIGFNYFRYMNYCSAVPVECRWIEESNVDFYRKETAGSMEITTTAAQKTVSTSPVFVPAPISGADDEGIDQSTYPGYKVLLSKTCEGEGSSDMAFDNDPEKCMTNCNRRGDCYGFNYYSSPYNFCGYVLSSCRLQDSPEGKFYRKGSASHSSSVSRTIAPVTKTRTTSTNGFDDVAISGFETMFNVKCIGGESVSLDGTQNDWVTCAEKCQRLPDCYGFNLLLSNGICTMQSNGCAEEEDYNYNFHRRTTEVTTLMTTHQSSSSSFEILADRRCVEGSSSTIQLLTTGLNDCKSSCLNDPDCFGFNLLAKSETCALRTAGCVVTENEGVSFYRKL